MELQTALAKIQAYESTYAVSKWPGGWTGETVGLTSEELRGLEKASLIVTVRDEGGRMCDVPSELATGYRLTAAGFHYRFKDDSPEVSNATSIEPPDDLFDSIVGYEEVKELLLASLRSPRPVHVLLIGPPALAKSLFLWEIERAYPASTLWLLGSAVSQSGMWDLVADQQPQVLLVDELEKIRPQDQAAFLSLMEGGRLVRARVRRRLDLTIECRVFAAANTVAGLTPELLSRFARRTLHPYGEEEFRRVVTSVLSRREGLSEELAQEIADVLVGHTQDVRDAIRVARIAEQVGVDRAVGCD